MSAAELEQRIQARGRELFKRVSGETPSIFRQDWWTGKVLDWAMHHEEFKVRLFRFVDVLPSLTSEESLLRHVEEYFGEGGREVPAVLRWGSKHEGVLGGYVSKVLAATILANHDLCHLASASHNIRAMAAVIEHAAVLKVPDERYEFQLLYGMAGASADDRQGAALRPVRRAAAGHGLPGASSARKYGQRIIC